MKKIIILVICFILVVLNFSLARIETQSSSSDSVPYVIITGDETLEACKELANWKTKKGAWTEVKTISEILTEYEYVGVDTPEKIRYFIRDKYNNNHTEWVLLWGTIDVVPSRYAWMKYYSVLTDYYYSCLKGNWNFDGDTLWGELEDSVDLNPQVYVGRIPVNDSSKAFEIVAKFLSYEKDSPYRDYQTKALFLSSQIYEPGDGKRLCDSLTPYLPPYFIKSQLDEYSPQTGIDSINSGFGLIVNYSMSESENNFITRWSPREKILNSDLDFLHNQDRYSILYNLTCKNNSHDLDCISLHFIANISGGLVGYIGSSGYDLPYFTQEFLTGIFDMIFNLGETNIGKTLALAKIPFISQAQRYNAVRYEILSFTLLGDPQMQIWTETPKDLFLIHPLSLETGTQSFDVTVKHNNTPVESSVVCLSQGEDVYEVRYTDAQGKAHFNVYFPEIGYADVYASKKNFITQQGNIRITESDPGGGGGCPFLYAWNGEQYVQDNNLLAGSENHNRMEIDLSDYYLVKKEPTVHQGYYKFQIQEFEKEVSYLDNFQLITVNHPKDVKIGVTPEGQIFSYDKLIPPQSCIDDQGIDRLNQIAEEDGKYFESQHKGYLIIDFSLIDYPIDDYVLYSSLPPNDKKLANTNVASDKELTVEVFTEKGEWQEISKIPPRANFDLCMINLSPYLVPQKGIKLKINWENCYRVDNIGFYSSKELTKEINRYPLSEAIHSHSGSVFEELLKEDKKYALLFPGQKIDLFFPSSLLDANLNRDFVILAKGHYITLDEFQTPEGWVQIPNSFILWQNYPNPFNPLCNIEYALPSDCKVTLSIYNVIGQKVRVLADAYQIAGYKSVKWDGKDDKGNDLASGVYFYRIQAGDFSETKKMLLLR